MKKSQRNLTTLRKCQYPYSVVANVGISPYLSLRALGFQSSNRDLSTLAPAFECAPLAGIAPRSQRCPAHVSARTASQVGTEADKHSRPAELLTLVKDTLIVAPSGTALCQRRGRQ
ncbi:hypothetical protein MRX96_038596 [Rhipicephalus microplus]